MGLMKKRAESRVKAGAVKDAQQKQEAEESDSGDSLFLTQSVTKRTLRSNFRNLESCNENKRSSNIQNKTPVKKKQRILPDSETDDEISDADFVPKEQTSCQKPKIRKKYPSTPYQPHTWLGKLTLSKRYVVMNSEVGGFFKCMKVLAKNKNKKRRELKSSQFASILEKEEEGEEEEEEDDDNAEIRKVDTSCFILKLNRRHQRPLLPDKNIMKNLASRKYAKKKSKNQDEEESNNQFPEDTQDPLEAQNNEESGDETLKSPNLSPIFFSDQKEPREGHVLVTSTQTQAIDWNPSEAVGQACEGSVKQFDDNLVICETQLSVVSNEESTPVVTMEKDALSQVDDELAHEEASLEDVQNDYTLVNASQDLFEEPVIVSDMTVQSTPRKRAGINTADEAQPITVVENAASRLSRKKKKHKARLSMNTLNVETPDDEIPNVSDETIRTPMMHQDRKEKTEVDNKSCVVEAQEEESAAESPLFHYSGLNFLKRKKRHKKCDVSQVQSAPLTVDENESLKSQDDVPGKRKEGKSKVSLEDCIVEPFKEPTDTLPKSNDVTGSNLSFLELEAGQTKQKKKKKEKKRKISEVQLSEGTSPDNLQIHPASSLGSPTDESEQAIKMNSSVEDNSLDIHSEVSKDFNSTDTAEPLKKRKKKKKAKKQDSFDDPAQSLEESESGYSTTEAKHRKNKKQNVIGKDMQESLDEDTQVIQADHKLLPAINYVAKKVTGGDLEVHRESSKDFFSLECYESPKKKAKKRTLPDLKTAHNDNNSELVVETTEGKKKKKKKRRFIDDPD